MYDLLLFQCGARSDNRVFIYFTTKITFFTIREFLEKNIENFKKSSTARKILVLSGIHGSDTGQAKSPEDDREEYFKGWNANFEKIQDQYKAQGITLNLFDISKIFECNEDLTSHVQKYDPNIIILGYCFSDRNKINHILRSGGVYAELSFKQEVCELHGDNIHASKLIKFDQAQKEVLDKFAKEKPGTVALVGHYGTGKTTILKNMLQMKISSLENQTIPSLDNFNERMASASQN